MNFCSYLTLARVLVLRGLFTHWLRSFLLMCSVALGVSVFVAVIYSAQASVASFERSAKIFDTPLEIRSVRGSLSHSELVEWYPLISARLKARAFALRSGSVSTNGSSSGTAIDILAIDSFEMDRSAFPRAEAFDQAAFVAPSFIQEVLGASLSQGEKTTNLCLLLNERKKCFAPEPLPENHPSAQALGLSLGGNTVVIDLSALSEWEGRELALSGIAVQLPSDLEATERTEWQNDVTEFVREVTGDLWVVQGETERQDRAQRLLGAFRMNIAVMVLMTLLVCVFTVYNASQLSMRTILPEIATLHTLGLPRISGALIFLAEPMVVGALGALLGLTLGYPLSEAIAALFLDTAHSLYQVSRAAEGLSILSSPLLYLVAFVAGITVCLVGSLLPALQARRVIPGVSSRSVRQAPPIRISTQLICAALAALLGLLSTWIAFDSGLAALGHVASFSLIALLVALASPALSLTIVLIRRCMRSRLSASVLAGMSGIQADLRTGATAVATTGCGLSLLIGLGVMIGSFRSSLEDWVKDSVVADIFISATTAAESIPEQFASEVVKQTSGDAPFGSITRFAKSLASVCLLTGDKRCTDLPIYGSDISQHPNARRYRLLSGAFNFEQFDLGKGVLISESASQRHQIHPNDRIKILGQEFQVLAVYKDFSTELGNVLLSFEVFQTMFNRTAPETLSIYLNAGNSVASVSQMLREIPGAQRVSIQDQPTLRASVFRIFDQTFEITALLRIVVIVVCALGFAITLSQLQWNRRREWRTLQILGASPSTIFSAVSLEALLLALPSLALGLGIGLLLSLVLIEVINPLSFGWSLTFTLHASTLGIPLLAVCLAFTLPLAWHLVGLRLVLRDAKLSDE